MILILTCMTFLVLIFFYGKINMRFQFRNQVRMLFDESKNKVYKKFEKTQIIGLPEPVQRYFNLVLKEGQPNINYVRILHKGQFKTGRTKNWITISGEQYVTTKKPGFIWKGTTSMFVARDSYISNQGKLTVSILSLINIVNAKGDKYNQGELLRWLGESVLYPTNLLSSQRLKWFPIDLNKSKLTLNYKGLSLYFTITFNEIGEITQMETKRYMNDKKLETWIIKLENYKEINNVTVPTCFEVLWRLTNTDFSYVKFHLNKIEYDIPKIF